MLSISASRFMLIKMGTSNSQTGWHEDESVQQTHTAGVLFLSYSEIKGADRWMKSKKSHSKQCRLTAECEALAAHLCMSADICKNKQQEVFVENNVLASKIIGNIGLNLKFFLLSQFQPRFQPRVQLYYSDNILMTWHTSIENSGNKTL